MKCKDGKWKCFDDSHIRDIDEKDIVCPQAYLLFYFRKDMLGIGITDVFAPRQDANGTMNEEELLKFIQKRDERCTTM